MQRRSFHFGLFFYRLNAAVQPQIRAQREFVGWNCLLAAALTQATLDVFMEDARDESLIGNTFSERALL